MLSKVDHVFEIYGEILFALDNDAAGNKATENCMMKLNLPDMICLDIRYIFNGSKDINEFLILRFETS